MDDVVIVGVGVVVDKGVGVYVDDDGVDVGPFVVTYDVGVGVDGEEVALVVALVVVVVVFPPVAPSKERFPRGETNK